MDSPGVAFPANLHAWLLFNCAVRGNSGGLTNRLKKVKKYSTAATFSIIRRFLVWRFARGTLLKAPHCKWIRLECSIKPTAIALLNHRFDFVDLEHARSSKTI